jgi:hypothetical protein
MPIVSKLKKNIRSGFSNKDYINSGDTPVFIAVFHEPWAANFAAIRESYPADVGCT